MRLSVGSLPWGSSLWFGTRNALGGETVLSASINANRANLNDKILLSYIYGLLRLFDGLSMIQLIEVTCGRLRYHVNYFELFCLSPNHHIIFYCITLCPARHVQFLGISLLAVVFGCGGEHCCNKAAVIKIYWIERFYALDLCLSVESPKDTQTRGLIGDSSVLTYRLPLLPQLHGRFVFLKLVTPVSVNFLIVVALVRCGASVGSRWEVIFGYEEACDKVLCGVRSLDMSYLWASTVMT